LAAAEEEEEAEAAVARACGGTEAAVLAEEISGPLRIQYIGFSG
jgi:hypothetical protein